jgi:glycyl-tRNA synthetase beta chain
MKPLLLEIGTEEIPAGYIQPALTALADQLKRRLAEARIEHGPIQTYGTPRRLVVAVMQVADRQVAKTEEVLGPPERIAFDPQGEPTLAARKFAEKIGVALSSLKVVDTGKGRYLAVKVKDKGQATHNILKQLLPEIILATPFPKTMRWSDLKIAFARPIRSVLALLGSAVVPFVLGERIKSGRNVYGHMFMQPDKIKIAHPDDYIGSLRNAQVIVEPEVRKAMVQKEIEAAADLLGGRILTDADLLDIVTNLVEIPIATGGRFDQDFLELPPEILITAMRKHQKYFAVSDHSGRLMPCFVAVNNTRARDLQLVVAGHERVLRARLSDAQFFYRADRQEKMDAWRQKLSGILFQAQLGSMQAKSERVEALCTYLADVAAPELKSMVTRAAQLCKTDLVSQVVYEFPDLQGIMGRTYALAAGESEEVAFAIEDHYRPTYSGGALPRSRTGALLAIADKLDSICGCFSVGLVPTGASDPYALRRQGIGVIQILLQQQFAFPLRTVISAALKPFDPTRNPAALQSVYTFLQNRIAHMLSEEGIAKDIVAAVITVGVDHIPYVWQRAAALNKMKTEPDFEPLAAAFKRVVNIIRKADSSAADRLDAALFSEAAEAGLYEAYVNVRVEVDGHISAGQFEAALRAIATLRQPVDRFFEEVMVMVDDPGLQRNRLALLAAIASLFAQIADFSKIAV